MSARDAAAPPAGAHVAWLLAETADIDNLDHVSNVVYVRWVLEAALSHSRAVGWHHERYVAAGLVFVVRRHEIDYFAPCLLGQRVKASTWVEGFSAATSVRLTRLVRVDETGAEQLLVASRTTWALVDMRSGRPRRISPELRTAFGLESA